MEQIGLAGKRHNLKKRIKDYQSTLVGIVRNFGEFKANNYIQSLEYPLLKKFLLRLINRLFDFARLEKNSQDQY